MSVSQSIRLRDIRSHEGSQARAWEELAYQLRSAPKQPGAETRKTRAPDGGVEWYDLYPDGHEEGFQAKFNECLQDALGGMRESVRAVADKRPLMTRLTFVVPYDFTDSGNGKTKSDQDRWQDAVAGWRRDIPGADRITFSVIRGGDVLDRLTLAEHAGRRAHWFGSLELTVEWFDRRWEESREIAGQRYTPDADTPVSINEVLQAVILAPKFLAEARTLLDRLSTLCRHDLGMWGADSGEVDGLLTELAEWRERTLGQLHATGAHQLPTSDPDYAWLHRIASGLAERAKARRDDLAPYARRNLDRALTSAEALRDFASGELAQVSTGRLIAITGPAGQGKTHALVRLCRSLLDEGAPALLVLGERLSDTTWWDAVAKAVGGVAATSDDFLQAMDSLAEACGRRGAIMIDALNEAQAPRRWREELGALVTQMRRYPHLALVVSFRADQESFVSKPGTIRVSQHLGLAGHESTALTRYCALFQVAEPPVSALDPAFSSPLFLRMYCEVLASEGGTRPPPTRSDLFRRFAEARTARVLDRLRLSPTSDVVHRALDIMADRLLDALGLPVSRIAIEPVMDSLLPGRPWPNTLFGVLVSEGLLEVSRSYDDGEAVRLPFQAYSEHLIAARYLDRLERENAITPTTEAGGAPEWAEPLRGRVWLWPAMAVLLPERLNVELVDVLGYPDVDSDDPGRAEYLAYVMADSFANRAPTAFGDRALQLLTAAVRRGLDRRQVEAVLLLAARRGHPADANWLHQELARMALPDRDATWSISTYFVDTSSAAYRRLTEWALAAGSRDRIDVESVASVLMWLLTSPNRFLRDEVTKTLVSLLHLHLDIMSRLVVAARDVDDPYVQQRVLTVAYGTVLVGGDDDLEGVHLIVDALIAWHAQGLPVDVLARDSARGVLAWAVDHRLATKADAQRFDPPYGADPPKEPPTADELEQSHGAIWGDVHKIVEWRAGAILRSCLTWMGDFNKYVVKGDVNFFSRHLLTGPAPTVSAVKDPDGEVGADWAGRWIAQRAITLGWTHNRFGDFEDTHGGSGDAHKSERFGKKYQWIAHHELLARLADNYHPAYHEWDPQGPYEGPWSWYGRDIGSPQDSGFRCSVRLRRFVSKGIDWVR